MEARAELIIHLSWLLVRIGGMPVYFSCFTMYNSEFPNWMSESNDEINYNIIPTTTTLKTDAYAWWQRIHSQRSVCAALHFSVSQSHFYVSQIISVSRRIEGGQRNRGSHHQLFSHRPAWCFKHHNWWKPQVVDPAFPSKNKRRG